MFCFKDQRAALLKLVQGPNSGPAKVKKSEQVVVQPRNGNGNYKNGNDNNQVQSRIPVNDDLSDGQLDAEGCMKKVNYNLYILYLI